jgi:hypothetical protein
MPDLAGRSDVRAAAQLDARAEADDPDDVAVALALHIDDASRDRFRERHLLDFDVVIRPDEIVDARSDLRALFFRELSDRRIEIEARAVCEDRAPALRDALACDVFERALQEMRHGMVPPDLAPPHRVDHRVDAVAVFERAG